MDPVIKNSDTIVSESIRVRGIVQGVGFRPTVWRIANDCDLRGYVINDADGVLIMAKGRIKCLDEFVKRLEDEAPPLARIDLIERQSANVLATQDQFYIKPSNAGDPRTGIAPDSAICNHCSQDIFNPSNRRYRYPFTNCTRCGPRFSIIKAMPYDRANTSMLEFTMCGECDDEYHDPSNRRFHAQPNACSDCGPALRLEHKAGNLSAALPTGEDDFYKVRSLLNQGEIIAIKGIGGFHLACNALDEDAVGRLRRRKQRYHKPFALMAYNIAIIKQYCEVNGAEEKALNSFSAPIVLLKSKTDRSVANAVAPAQTTLGFMLPYSPVYQLILHNIDYPIVLTSGNISDEPPCIDNAIAKQKLSSIADHFLFNDREIVNRIDDSVVRVIANNVQIIRRARGYAPAPIELPEGFVDCPEILAMGGELKNTFCLIKAGKAIISQHLGDLENAATFIDYRKNLHLYRKLYQTSPKVIAIDRHPDYLSGKEGRQISEETGTTLNIIQHHHAHIAGCMAENKVPLNTEPILGVALDGIGYGEDDTLWGGEFLLTDYVNFERLATLKPVALPGGVRAIYEPWRNTYAQIKSAFSWQEYKIKFNHLALTKYIESKPIETLHRMMEKNINCPLSGSCGRLFDAVAAAIGICRERVAYEGQAAMEMEAIVAENVLTGKDESPAYPFSISMLKAADLACVDPSPIWRAILRDIDSNIPNSVIAARFHRGLADIICAMIKKLAAEQRDRHINTVALSGGVFQNKILTELVILRLKEENFTVIKHKQVPANDGGLSFGQALIAGARVLKNIIKV